MNPGPCAAADSEPPVLDGWAERSQVPVRQAAGLAALAGLRLAGLPRVAEPHRGLARPAVWRPYCPWVSEAAQSRLTPDAIAVSEHSLLAI